MTLESRTVEYLQHLSVMYSAADRRAFLFVAFGGDRVQIDYGGDSRTFCNRLVTRLVRYGRMNDGRSAMEVLLAATKTPDLGPDDQQTCDELIAEWRDRATTAKSSQKVADSPPLVLSHDQLRGSAKRNRFLLVAAGILAVLVVGYLVLYPPWAAPDPGPIDTPLEAIAPTQPPEPEATHTPTLTSINTPVAKCDLDETRTAEKDNQVQVCVPEGRFLMGAEETDPSADSDEVPKRWVWLNTFWIDQTEITNAQYVVFLNDMRSQGADSIEKYIRSMNASGKSLIQLESTGLYVTPRDTRTDPVTHVTWYGADAYCRWAGRDLPTEAEWEKSARGVSGNTYPWGHDIPNNRELANYSSRGTQPVASFVRGASPYGAYDMAGNVWEWVADWYGDSYYREALDQNPLGPDSGTHRVLRGGSWMSGAHSIRTHNRHSEEPTHLSSDIGFRCAQSAGERGGRK